MELLIYTTVGYLTTARAAVHITSAESKAEQMIGGMIERLVCRLNTANHAAKEKLAQLKVS